MNSELPTKPRSFRLTETDLQRLERLRQMLGRSQTDVVSMAIAHLLATMQRDERVHLAPEDEGGGR